MQFKEKRSSDSYHCWEERYDAKRKSGLKSRDFSPLRVNMRLFPLIFGNLRWLIYDLNIILNGNFESVFPPIISFIKISVAEKLQNRLRNSAGWLCGKGD